VTANQHDVKVYRLEVLGKPITAKNHKEIGRYKDPKSPTGWRYVLVDSKAAKRWRRFADPQLGAQWSGHEPLTGNLAAVITSYCGKGNTPDVDNLLAGPFDSLQAAGVVSNDSVFDTAVSIRRRDRENPRSEILIMPDDWLDIRILRPDGGVE
jgi:Holliday junction resolvase RusA-like endonuclease